MVEDDFILEDAIKEVVALIFDRLNLQLWQEYIILNRQVCDDFILEDAIKEVLALILDRFQSATWAKMHHL